MQYDSKHTLNHVRSMLETCPRTDQKMHKSHPSHDQLMSEACPNHTHHIFEICLRHVHKCQTHTQIMPEACPRNFCLERTEILPARTQQMPWAYPAFKYERTEF